MSTNIPTQVPFLRAQRLFPKESQPLSVEIDRAYVDIANAVNNRVVGIYSSTNPVQSGRTFYINGLKYQGFSKFFQFTSTTSINHDINFDNVSSFTNGYGSFTDGTNWYGLMFASSVAIAGQISFYITPTQIVFATGAGAPTLTSGLIVIEWITQA